MQAMVSHPRVGDLTNKIHAVFQRSNFKNISDDEYTAIEPALRLATRLLTTKELAGFPHALLVAPFRYLKRYDDSDEWSFERKGPSMTPQDMADYESALSKLAENVTFLAESAEPKSCGSCGKDWNTIPKETHLKVGSTIYFSRQDVECSVTTQDWWPGELVAARHFLLLARILVHELIHAMSHARLGEYWDIPFESQTVWESGYEWEGHVFGGLLGCQEGNLYEPLVFRDWPSASTSRHYQTKDYPIVVVQDPPSIEINWKVEPFRSDWLTSLFSTRFWEYTVPEKGAIAVKVPKIRGLRYKVAEDGEASLFDASRDVSSEAIPAGYIEDWDGEIVIE